MRCLPILLFFFSTINQFDWPIKQKNETMEAPQDRRFYFEVLSSSPLAHPYGWKEDNNLPKHMGLKWDAMENMLGNTLGTWATYWEREKNEKKNPSSSQQSLGWAPNSNLIQFPWPQGISLLQNGPFYEVEGPMPDFAGLHRGV
jgi:hypothetical protein